MKYVAPYGIADENAGYINGDPSIARQGSIPPAEAFEHPMRELVAVIDDSFFIPDADDLEQVAKSIRSQRMNYAEDTGSVNTLSVAYSPPITNYSIGLPLHVKIRSTNTGPASIDAGGGRVSIKKPNGAEMAANDLPAGGLAHLVYDGTAFQMINFGGAGGTGGGITVINIPYTVDTGTVNNVIANFSPAITSYSTGLIVMVKAANTNTGASTININGLGTRPIYAIGGSPEIPFLPSDMMAGDVMILTYDGTRFWMTANPALNVNSTFNAANVTDIATTFRALARKRIQPTVTVTLQLATGIYAPFSVYHVDASRITVQGTMLTTVPVAANFAKTGSSAGARAADSANNIAMLRSRYGTEIRINNAALLAGGVAVQNIGPGMATFRNLLVTGDNTPSGNTNGAAFAAVGGPTILQGCSVWGIGSNSFNAVSNGSLSCANCFSSSAQSQGCLVSTGGTIILSDSGIFGGSGAGAYASTNGTVWFYTNVQCQSNAINGCTAISGGNVWLGAGTILTNNAGLDAYAYGGAMISTSGGITVGTASPAVGTTGNLGSVNVG